MKKIIKKILISIILISIVFPVSIIAQENLDLPNPGLTPDSPFYFLDTFWEKTILFFTFSSEKKAEKALSYAKEKIAEIKVMAEKNKTQAFKKANDNYQEFLNIADQEIKKVEKQGKNIERLSILITENILNHQEVLIEIFEKVPNEAKTAIEKAIEASRDSSEAIQSITGKKKKEIIQKIKEIKSKCENYINRKSCKISWTSNDYIQNQIDMFIPSDEEIMNYQNKDDLKGLNTYLNIIKGFIWWKLPAPELGSAINNIEGYMGQIYNNPPYTQQQLEILVSYVIEIRNEFYDYSIKVDEIYREIVGDEIDVYIQENKPQKYHDMHFSVESSYTSYKAPEILTEQEMLNEIRFLSELPVDSIRIDLKNDIWRTYRDLYKDTIIPEIRNQGKEVYITTHGGQYWHLDPKDWSDFKSQYYQDISDIVDDLNPDYINILGESPYYSDEMVNEVIPINEWINLIENIVEMVKNKPNPPFIVIDTVPYEISPAPYEGQTQTYIQLMNSNADIDAIGIDPYSHIELQERGEFAIEYRDPFKELWIGQTWFSSGGRYINDLADKYITYSVYYAQNNNLTGYVLFYGRNLHTKDFKKTPAFYAYKNVIEEVREKVEKEVIITTDKTEYELGENMEIVVTIINNLNSNITTLNMQAFCSIIRLEQQEETEWKEVENCFSLIATRPVTFEPHTDTIVKLPTNYSSGPINPGIYRASIVFVIGETYWGEETLISYSNEFIIK